MNQEKFEKDNIVRIILNPDYEILHSNVNRDEANSYLVKLTVLDNIADNTSVQYCIKNSHVIIDRFIFNNQPYYMILITLINDCSVCTKVLKDEVTGLFNRNFLEQIVEDKIPYSNIAYLSLILADIDNLKEINDTQGHLVGDKAIKVVGYAISNCIRKSDVGIRYGGDEFIILLPNQNRIAAEKVMRRIRIEIDRLAQESGIVVKISAGISSNNYSSNLEDMINMADTELYNEKEAKKKEHKDYDVLVNIRREIETIRNELDSKIYQNQNQLTANDVLEVSQKLDDLVLKYLDD